MILQLRSESIMVKSPYIPENIDNTKISYVFELNTNQYRPKLYIGSDVYYGNNIYVDFSKYTESTLDIKVELLDNVNRVMRTYTNSFRMYRTFALGTQEQIDVYKELIKARNKIRELEERGEVI